MKLSFCLITKNEEANLPRCLTSVAPLADEIIVLDTDSTDRTVQIAREYGASVFVEEWKGYGAQKNSAAQKASHPWVFSIDADEEISPALAGQITQWKKREDQNPTDAWEICRCVFYEGKWIRHGDWYPDWVVRIFHREHSHFTEVKVHESVTVPGQKCKLPGDLYHYTYKDYADQLERIDKYAHLWAGEKARQGKSSSPLAPHLHSLSRFLRGYIIKGGFRDGKLGAQIALANAHEVFLKYKLLQEKTRHP
ncbi:MAG: glycosyltransferase family 2 protein [Verrucomicrobiota bacterium]|nr:glycosyltransferase family 2 protein [Verrucomicrobiota bacterium]